MSVETINGALKFRATFNDPGDKTLDRPVQVFASTRAEIDHWVKKKLEAGGEQCYCLIYETSEQLTGLIRKPPKPADTTKYTAEPKR